MVGRERAGTHHRAPRVRRAWPAVGSMTREAWHRSTNSPARHVICNLLVSITRTRSPVGNVFSLIAVRELLWKGTGAAGWVKGVGRDVFMASIVFFRPGDVIPNASQYLGTPANGPLPGANHG